MTGIAMIGASIKFQRVPMARERRRSRGGDASGRLADAAEKPIRKGRAAGETLEERFAARRAKRSPCRRRSFRAQILVIRTKTIKPIRDE